MSVHQRSPVNWLSFGDRNTTFFHATLTQRRQRNQLVRLKSDSGIWLESEEDINAHLHNYFVDLFSFDGHRDMTEALSVVNQVITNEMNLQLIREVSNEEIRVAVFQLGSVKALGPNGYPGFFYHQYWAEIGTNVCMAVRNFFTSGFLPQE
ncbi:hypothetical protein ACSBR1_005410 [Camellia fascicularis]